MENSDKVALYKERLPVYFILAISAFQIPFIFTYLPTANEAFLFNYLTTIPAFSSFITFVQVNLIPEKADDIQYLRILSFIVVTFSAIFFYRFCKKILDLPSAFFAVFIYVISPITQVTYLLFVPFSIFLLIGTLTLSMLNSGLKGKAIRGVIVAAVMIALIISLQYIDRTFFIMNALSFATPFIAFYVVKFSLSVSKQWVIYLVVLIFLAGSVYTKVAPIYNYPLPYFSNQKSDLKSLSQSIFTSMRQYDTIVMEDIKDAAMIRYYLKTSNPISSIDPKTMGRNCIIILQSDITDNQSVLPLVYKNIDMIGVYTYSDNNGNRNKYYIYRAAS